jgi:hypothetical protein
MRSSPPKLARELGSASPIRQPTPTGSLGATAINTGRKQILSGNFTLPNVRPGTYTLSAYVTGEVGEYTRTNVKVTAGNTTALGDTTWVIAHPGRSIAWEIGIP